jgi:hypothetical protein
MVGQTTELLVQERNELVEGVTIAASDLPEEHRNL